MQVYEGNKTKQLSYLLIIFQQSLFLQLITYLYLYIYIKLGLEKVIWHHHFSYLYILYYLINRIFFLDLAFHLLIINLIVITQ